MIQRIGHIVLYVESVKEAMAFYQKAFGFPERKCLVDGSYGELDTGSNCLAFACASLMAEELSWVPTPNQAGQMPGRVELCLDTDNILSDYQKALNAGAISLAHPKLMPWGQIVAFLQDPQGVTLELCQASAAKHDTNLL